jgi:LacI family asc operon transcriptional repressor
MAIGAMKQLHQLGVKVPEQVSVIGFDDIAGAVYGAGALQRQNTGDGDDQRDHQGSLCSMAVSFNSANLPGELIERDSMAPHARLVSCHRHSDDDRMFRLYKSLQSADKIGTNYAYPA